MKIRSATFIKSGTRPQHFPESQLPEVAFAGRSNVGKSSLMNRLMERKKLVKVSSTPGRTQLLSWFNVNDEVLLCDLPGYGFAKVPPQIRASWSRMIGEYLDKRETLLALVIIVDVRRGFEEDDMMLVTSCRDFELQPILVATKCDKLSRNELYNRKRAICAEVSAHEADIVWFSAETGAGRDDLWRRIVGLTAAGATAGA
jgi:GTP-binding protein